MIRKVLFSALAISFFALLQAEEWTVEADASLSMNQNSYSNNWSGDEKSSLSWAANLNFLAEKQLSAMLHNKNTLKLAFGQTHNQYVNEEGDKNWAKPDKSTDLVDLESILRFTLGVFVDPYLSGRWQSQFLDESIPGDTKIFNPNTLTESFGIARIFIKDEKKEFSTRLGAAFKQYLNSHEGIDNTNDGGVEFVADYKSLLAADNITFNSKLNVYKAVYYSESDALEGTEYEDDWKAPRLTWENIISAKLTRLISLNLNVTMIYDETKLDKEGKSIKDIQIKETLALGVSYKLL